MPRAVEQKTTLSCSDKRLSDRVADLAACLASLDRQFCLDLERMLRKRAPEFAAAILRTPEKKRPLTLDYTAIQSLLSSGMPATATAMHEGRQRHLLTIARMVDDSNTVEALLVHGADPAALAKLLRASRRAGKWKPSKLVVIH